MSNNLNWLQSRKIKPQTIKQVVMSQSNNKRKLSHTKVRNEVSGSTRKIYRQKGTGNARAGSVRSPIRVGGGCVWGPRFHIKNIKINKKAALAARLDILRRHLEAGNIIVQNINITKPCTKDAVQILTNLSLSRERILIINHEENSNLKLSFNNLFNVKINNVININAMDLINAQKVIITEQASEELTQKYGVK